MHPYHNLPPAAYWRSAVAEVNPLEMTSLYRPRFELTRNMKIATAGSCFAQHIGRTFKTRGYNVLDVESAPAFLQEEDHVRFGFGMYSARFGNIYTIRHLVQLFKRASGDFKPDEQLWKTNGRYYDPFRPSVEPSGFATPEEAFKDIAYHLAQVNKLLGQTDVFVFTFGLTEGWLVQSDGAALPTCPGTIAGDFDPTRYIFKNFNYESVLADAIEFIEMAREIRNHMRFLVTVSPVPLPATASGHHVLPATVYSKSVLRAVCGALVEKYDYVDYFPSFEIISSHPMRGMFYKENMRKVTPQGVEHVMNCFFRAHGHAEFSPIPSTSKAQNAQFEPVEVDEYELACDELMLEQYARNGPTNAD